MCLFFIFFFIPFLSTESLMLLWFHSDLRRAVVCTPLTFHSPWPMVSMVHGMDSKAIKECSSATNVNQQFFQALDTKNNITKQLSQKQVSIPHLIFYRLTVLQMLLCTCSLKITLKIYKLHIVLGRSVKQNKVVVNC